LIIQCCLHLPTKAIWISTYRNRFTMYETDILKHKFIYKFDTTLYDKVCQWLAAGRWFSPGTPVSSPTKAGGPDITDTLLKVVLNTINGTPKCLFEELWFFVKKKERLENQFIHVIYINVGKTFIEINQKCPWLSITTTAYTVQIKMKKTFRVLHTYMTL
jgi:hypothetical protein